VVEVDSTNKPMTVQDKNSNFCETRTNISHCKTTNSIKESIKHDYCDPIIKDNLCESAIVNYTTHVSDQHSPGNNINICDNKEEQVIMPPVQTQGEEQRVKIGSRTLDNHQPSALKGHATKEQTGHDKTRTKSERQSFEAVTPSQLVSLKQAEQADLKQQLQVNCMLGRILQLRDCH
jgi:hypothetical protein